LGSRLKGFYINPSRQGPAVPAAGPEGPPRPRGPGTPPGAPGGSPPPRLGAKVPDGVSGAGSPAGRFGYNSDKQMRVIVSSAIIVWRRNPRSEPRISLPEKCRFTAKAYGPPPEGEGWPLAPRGLPLRRRCVASGHPGPSPAVPKKALFGVLAGEPPFWGFFAVFPENRGFRGFWPRRAISRSRGPGELPGLPRGTAGPRREGLM